MSVSSPPASAGPITRGTLNVSTISVLVGAAAIAGLLLGGSFSGGDAPSAPRPASVPHTIAHEGLRLQVPSGWVRGDAVSVLGFSRPLGLRSEDDSMRATVELLPATSATLLPAAFLKTLRTVPERPDVVRLAAGRPAWRYRFPEDDGSVTILYAAPTTSGVVTVACLSPSDGGVPRGCEAVARAITAPGSRPLELGTSAAFDSRVPAVVSDLDAARTRGTRQLAASKHSTDQAAAAGGLAQAHRAARAALAPLTAEGDGLPSTTVRALAETATAYAALASATRDRSPRPYAQAARAVTTADAGLRRSLSKVAAAVKAPAEAKVKTSTKVKTSVQAEPAASTSRGIDLSLPLLVLLGVFAIVLAFRQMLRAPV